MWSDLIRTVQGEPWKCFTGSMELAFLTTKCNCLEDKPWRNHTAISIRRQILQFWTRQTHNPWTPKTPSTTWESRTCHDVFPGHRHGNLDLWVGLDLPTWKKPLHGLDSDEALTSQTWCLWRLDVSIFLTERWRTACRCERQFLQGSAAKIPKDWAAILSLSEDSPTTDCSASWMSKLEVVFRRGLVG